MSVHRFPGEQIEALHKENADPAGQQKPTKKTRAGSPTLELFRHGKPRRRLRNHKLAKGINPQAATQ
jgi:hypothetical protein